MGVAYIALKRENERGRYAMFRLPKDLRPKAIILVAGLTLLSACGEERTPVRGFVLPPGNAEQGEVTFVELGCSQCHTVADSAIEQPPGALHSVPLGGKVMRVRHYGDLLTSIVSPDHRVLPMHRGKTDGAEEETPMPQYTDTMTVTQLIDLVEFLHGRYTTMTRYGGRYYDYAVGT